MDVCRALLLCILFAISVSADVQLGFSVKGVGEPLRTNVLNHVDSLELGRAVRLSDRDMDRIQQKAIERATVALRPYGYYHPTITGRYTRDGKGVFMRVILGNVCSQGCMVLTSDQCMSTFWTYL